MDDVASKIEFKRKQIASLADNGSDEAKAGIARLRAQIAALDPASPEGVEAAAAAPKPAPSPEHAARIGAAESAIAELRATVSALTSRLAVVEVLTAPEPKGA